MTDADGFYSQQSQPPRERVLRGSRFDRALPLNKALISNGNARDSLRWALCSAGASIGLCLLVGIYAISIRPSAQDRIFLVAVLMFPAFCLAVSRSTLLLDWFFVVVVINRLLRRLLDWGEGRFDELPLLSVTPHAIAMLMLPVILTRWPTLSKQMRRGGLLLTVAIGYGVTIGFRNGFGAIYAAADYATPLIILFWCVTIRVSRVTVARWLTVLITLAVLAAAYGVAQWAWVPPWDASWIQWSRMWSSMGQPIPYKMSIASTLESRGPAAWFFANALVIAIGLPFARRPWGLFAPLVCAFALLLTTVRTGLIFTVLSILGSVVFAGRRSGWRVMVPFMVVAIGAVVALRSVAQTELVGERLATLGNLGADSSTAGRLQGAQQGLFVAVSNPFGFGLGSGGIADRLDASATGAVGDNGYLEILTTLGLPGTALYVSGLAAIVRPLLQRRGVASSDRVGDVGRGILIAMVPSLLVFNFLAGVHAAYMWILVAHGLVHQSLPRDRAALSRQRASVPIQSPPGYGMKNASLEVHSENNH